MAAWAVGLTGGSVGGSSSRGILVGVNGINVRDGVTVAVGEAGYKFTG